MNLRFWRRYPSINERAWPYPPELPPWGDKSCPCTFGEHSGCGACRRSWCEFPEQYPYHITSYSIGHSMFPLCKECWRRFSTPEARLPYYRSLFCWWVLDAAHHDGKVDAKWEDIVDGVYSEAYVEPVGSLA